jgi:hypothetical protein
MPAERYGLPQRVLDQVGKQTLADGPSEDPTGVTIPDDTGTPPPLTGMQIVDVREPGEIPFTLVKLPLHEAGDGEPVIATD